MEANSNPRLIAQKVLQAAERDGRLPEGTAGYVLGVLDPYHDTSFTPRGVPTKAEQKSIVRLIQRTGVVDCTAGGTTGANKQVTFTLFPTDNAISLSQGFMSTTSNDVTYGTSLAPTGSHDFMVGGMTYSIDTDGSGFHGSGQVLPSFGKEKLPVHSGANYRIIGAAMEIINDSPLIDVGGAVYVNQSPGIIDHRFVKLNSPVYPNTSAPAFVLNRMPQNLAELIAYPSTRSWKSADGVLAVAKLDNLDDTRYWTCGAGNTLVMQDFPGTVTPIGDPNCWARRTATFAWPTMQNISPDMIAGPHKVVTVVFTGLPETTTLRYTVRWLFEEIPSPGDADALAIAVSTPRRTPAVEQLVAEAQRMMADGYVFGSNRSGRYWASIAEGLKKILATVAPVLPPQFKAPAIAAAGMIGGIQEKRKGMRREATAMLSEAHTQAEARAAYESVPKASRTEDFRRSYQKTLARIRTNGSAGRRRSRK
jgi:hypothetical protein